MTVFLVEAGPGDPGLITPALVVVGEVLSLSEQIRALRGTLAAA